MLGFQNDTRRTTHDERRTPHGTRRTTHDARHEFTPVPSLLRKEGCLCYQVISLFGFFYDPGNLHPAPSTLRRKQQAVQPEHQHQQHPAPSTICCKTQTIRLRFVLTKKTYTFANEFGPIVQWIEWRFPKP